MFSEVELQLILGIVIYFLFIDFRGESGPCCFAISQSDDIPNKCNFRWTLNTDLKIRLPKFILDNAIMNSQFTFMSHLRKRIMELKEELSLNDSV